MTWFGPSSMPGVFVGAYVAVVLVGARNDAGLPALVVAVLVCAGCAVLLAWALSRWAGARRFVTGVALGLVGATLFALVLVAFVLTSI